MQHIGTPNTISTPQHASSCASSADQHSATCSFGSILRQTILPRGTFSHMFPAKTMLCNKSLRSKNMLCIEPFSGPEHDTRRPYANYIYKTSRPATTSTGISPLGTVAEPGRKQWQREGRSRKSSGYGCMSRGPPTHAHEIHAQHLSGPPAANLCSPAWALRMGASACPPSVQHETRQVSL